MSASTNSIHSAALLHCVRHRILFIILRCMYNVVYLQDRPFGRISDKIADQAQKEQKERVEAHRVYV